MTTDSKNIRHPNLEIMRTKEFSMNGQNVVHNEFNNVVATTINSVFITAWELLGWEFQSSGIGINIDLVTYILDKEARLFVTLTEGNKKYIINANEIREFIKNNKTEYIVGKTRLVVLPVLKFKEM